MENKNKFFEKYFSLRNLFLFGNVLLLVLFLAVVLKDQCRGWKYYQAEFKKKEITRLQEKLASAVTPEEKDLVENELKVARRSPIEIRQLWVQELESVDRCISCHLGYDPLSNPSLTTDYKEHPYSASGASPALDIHKAHNIEKFGCAVCHGGQALATETDAAHGNVLHWEKPLLKGALLQVSCAKCHDNLPELKINNEVYPSEILRAKELFRENGCIGCHQVGGEGGPISVDLKEETSAKPLSRIDFNFSGLPHEEWTLANWIKIHFVKDPASFVPGDPKGEFNTEPISPSAMPPYFMPEKDAEALTAYILGLNRKGIPVQYLTLRAHEQEKAPEGSAAVKGRYVYEKYGCTACHGADARGGIRNYNSMNDVTPNLRKAASLYSRDEIKHKINEGIPFIAKHDGDGPQPPLYMPAWKAKIKGEELENLISYLVSIKE